MPMCPVSAPLDDGRAPAEARAKACARNHVALFHLAALDRGGERDGDGARGRVAVLVQVRQHLPRTHT